MKPASKVALIAPNWAVWEQRLLSGALRYADAHPRIIIRVFAPTQDVPATVAELESWGANGAFGFLENADLQKFTKSIQRPIPLTNCSLAGSAPGVISVLGDFRAFLEVGLQHLRHLGLRAISLLVLEEGAHISERLVQPFLAMTQSKNFDRSAMIFPADRTLLWNPEAKVDPVPRQLATWLKNLPKPAGVIVPQLGGGGYLIRCCKALGIPVPDEVAVLGSDDTDFSLACDPSLSSVLLSVETLGFEAMRVLAGMMEGEPPPATAVLLKCLTLNVRESTGLRRPEICDIGGALECIRDNATRGITVDEVIKRTQKVSRVTFHRRFQQVVGKSPAEVIRERKLEEARRLLSSTELPLEIVSELSGFSSARVMARVFRVSQGESPRDYRKMKQLAAV